MTRPVGGPTSIAQGARVTGNAPAPSANAAEATSEASPTPQTEAERPDAERPAPQGDRFEASNNGGNHVTGAVTVRFAAPQTGSTNAPTGTLPPAMEPAAVPGDATLAQLRPDQRARLLGRLTATAREAEDMPPGPARDQRLADTRAAIDRVVDSTPDGKSLNDTLSIAARNGTLGAITESVGLERLIDAGNARGTNVNDVLATSDTVKERGLTTYERGQIERNFGGTLDPDTVRFKFTPGVQTMGAGAMVIGNTIHVDSTDPRWGFAPGTTQPRDPQANDQYNQVLLAHEPAHVWSYQHQGSQYALNSVTDQAEAIASGGGRGGAYDYKPDRPSFYDYGEEQRAGIVEDYVAAQRAQARGVAEMTLPVQGTRMSPTQAIAELEPYIREMRAAGPGNPHPPGAPHAHVHGPTQDGLAEFVADHADAALAGAGQLAMDAIGSGEPLQVAAGAAGVAAVVAGSLVTREQNWDSGDGGANGGGSALLDQAGIPRGVEASGQVGGVALSGAAQIGYDAAPRWDPETYEQQIIAPPENVRVEVSGSAAGTIGDTSLAGTANAAIGIDGSLQQAGGTFSVQAPDLSVYAQGSYDGRGANEHAQASVDVQGADFGAQLAGNATWNEGGVQSAELSGRVDTQPFSAAANLQLGPDWSFQSLDASAHLRQPGWSVFMDARVTPSGLDAIGGGVSAQLGESASLNASARAEDLTGLDPRYSGSLAVGTSGGTSVRATGSHRPATGDSTFQVGLVIPLKP